jgi:hypothetical protein
MMPEEVPRGQATEAHPTTILPFFSIPTTISPHSV